MPTSTHSIKDTTMQSILNYSIENGNDLDTTTNGHSHIYSHLLSTTCQTNGIKLKRKEVTHSPRNLLNKTSSKTSYSYQKTNIYNLHPIKYNNSVKPTNRAKQSKTSQLKNVDMFQSKKLTNRPNFT